MKARLDLAPLAQRAAPAVVLPLDPRSEGRDPMFHHVMLYLQVQHAQVEPLYRLDQARKFRVEQPPADPEAVAFIERQLLAGGQMLGNLWLTAWRTAAPDPFLRGQLIKQKTSAGE